MNNHPLRLVLTQNINQQNLLMKTDKQDDIIKEGKHEKYIGWWYRFIEWKLAINEWN